MAKRKNNPEQSQNPSQLIEVWFLRHRRDLPWRQTQDPYAIWISEIMLQQTQVQAVVPYYFRFLKEIPDIETLANIDEEILLNLWSGLGYYSRARNLQKGAKFILQNHGRKIPTQRDQLLKVPGVGPYTAGAILSIAFNLPVPLVDGNVQRVFSRYFGIQEIIDSPSIQKKFWNTADIWVKAAKNPRDFNQGLMELGALVCTKNKPRCAICPLTLSCVAKRLQIQDKLPKRKTRTKTKKLYWYAKVYHHRDKIFLIKNTQKGWWKDLWDFPIDSFPNKKALSRVLSQLRLNRENGKELPRQVHTVTHHRIEISPYLFSLKSALTVREKGQWFSKKNLQNVPMSSLVRKVIKTLPEDLAT